MANMMNLTDRNTVFGLRVFTDGNALVPAVTHYSHFQTALIYELQIHVFPTVSQSHALDFRIQFESQQLF